MPKSKPDVSDGKARERREGEAPHPSERDAVELWNELVAEAAEDAIAEALRPSDAEVERDLRAAGFDVAEENARAAAAVAGTVAAKAQRPRRRPE